MFVISKGQNFISAILKVVNPLVKQINFFSLLRFEIQNNYKFETLKFKLHSFIPLELHVNEQQHQFFDLVYVIYERNFLINR